MARSVFFHKSVVHRPAVTWPRGLSLAAALSLAWAALVPATLRAQGSTVSTPGYSPTLLFGTGLVQTPVAWVSPQAGDLWVATSLRPLGAGSQFTPRASGSVWDLTLNAEAHLRGRLALGASLYGTTNQQVGAFIHALAYRAPAGSRAPNVALGVRGLGLSPFQDRFLTGSRRIAQDVRAATGREPAPINGNPSPYLVATREFATATGLHGSLSLGYGTGLFRNRGGMDSSYNPRGSSGGLFGGARLVLPAGRPDASISLLLEHDAWDVNAGVVARFNHITVGLLLTELDERKGTPDARPLGGYTKANLLLGYNGNLREILRGSRQRAEATEQELVRQRLRRELQQREARMRELTAAITNAANDADAAATARRRALEAQLAAEREAMRKAAEQLEKSRKPPAGTS